MPDPIFDLDSLPKPPDQTPKAVDRAPIPLVQGHPQYPYRLRAARLEGCAIVDFVIATDGTVRDANAVLNTNAQFAQAAVAAVVRWKFQPGLRRGRPVNVHMQVPMVFSLGQDSGTAGDASAQLMGLYSQLAQCWTKLREARVGQGEASRPADLAAQRIYLQLVFAPDQAVVCNSQVEPAEAVDGEVIAAALSNLVDGYAFTLEVSEWLAKNPEVELTLTPWH